VNIYGVKQGLDFIMETRFLDKVEISSGSNDEARGHRDTGVGHFAEISSLTANNWYILFGNFVEPDDCFLTFLHFTSVFNWV